MAGRNYRSEGEWYPNVGFWPITNLTSSPQTRIAVEGPRNYKLARREYTSEDLQLVQTYEDKTNEAIMVLEANADVLTSLRQFYERLMENKDFPLKKTGSGDIFTFATQVNDMIYDLRMQISRAKLLVRITADRKSLVRFCFFFELFRLESKDLLFF